MSTLASLRILLGLDPAGVKTGGGQVRSEMVAIQRSARETDGAMRGAGKGIVDTFGGARSSISKTAAAGSQLALVGSSIGGAFGGAAAPVGEFLRIAGNLGLVASTAAELGPGLAAAARGVVGLGSAAATATPAVDGFAAAETAAGAGALGIVGVLGPLAVVVGATALAIGEIRQDDDRLSEAQAKVAAGSATMYDRMAAQAAAHHAAAAAAAAHGKAMSSLVDVQIHLTDATGKNEFATTTLTGTALLAAEAAEKHRLRLLGEEVAVRDLKTSVDTLGTSLEDLPRDISITVDVGLTGAGAGAFAQGFATTGTPAGNTDFGPTHGSTGDLGGTTADPAFVAAEARRKAEDAARRAQQAADEARRKAELAAADAERAHAQAIKDKLAAAYDLLADRVHAASLRIHDDNLKAIQDAHDRRDAELDAQKAANLQPVTEAEAAFRAIKQQRELAQLQADLANAETPEDRLKATQALSDFTMQSQIDQMHADADTANAALDVEKHKNDLKLAADMALENTRYANQQKADAAALKQLHDHLDKVTSAWGLAFAEIAQLAKQYGISNLVGIHPAAAAGSAAGPGGRTATTPASGATGFVPRLLYGAMAGVTAAQGEPVHHVHVYLEGKPLLDYIDRGLGLRRNAKSSGGVAW